MKRTTLMLAMVAFLCLGLDAALYAQEFPRGGAPSNPAAGGNTTVAAQLNQQLSFVERQFVDAADVMPQDKYSFVPMSEFPSGTVAGPTRARVRALLRRRAADLFFERRLNKLR